MSKGSILSNNSSRHKIKKTKKKKSELINDMKTLFQSPRSPTKPSKKHSTLAVDNGNLEKLSVNALHWIEEDSLSSEENLETTESTRKIGQLLGIEIHEYELVKMRR